MSLLSLIFVTVLLVCQGAVVVHGDVRIVMGIVAAHVLCIVVSVVMSFRRCGSVLPQYSRVPVLSDFKGVGNAINIPHDDALIGSIVGGLFFGLPAVVTLFSQETPFPSDYRRGFFWSL